MSTINSLEDIRRIVDSRRQINLYGAGVRLRTFWDVLQEIGFSLEVKQVLVTNAAGNASFFEHIPIRSLDDVEINENDAIILTISEAYINEVIDSIRAKSALCQIYVLDFSVIERIRVNRIQGQIQGLLDSFDLELSMPDDCINKYPKRVWSVWWQGMDQVPNIVSACFESWKNYVPAGYEITIITEKNYKDYINIPEYILDRVKRGEMCLAHLSDYIRFSLLYYYGGLWLDATVYLVDYVPANIFDYHMYTRTFEGRDFGADVTWGIWFMSAKSPGESLYKFVKEAHEYFWKNYDCAPYYLITDYFISIACNNYQKICDMLKVIPTNNILAMELGKHLAEDYSEDKYKEYTKNTFFQKLSWHGKGYSEESFYQKIVQGLERKDTNGE